MEKPGKVLYDKNAYERAYPASLTKMLTAIVTVEHCNLSEIVVYNSDCAKNMQDGYIVSNLSDGEEVTVETLLNLLLICSYNDTANMLAMHISGDIEEFVKLMNQKAIEIGCKDSHFVNTYGLHNSEHYSTAYDMALIAQYAMRYESLRQIVSKLYFTLGDTNVYSGAERVYHASNGLLLYGNPDTYYKYAKGIKTGFTTPAGHCLASYAIKDDMELYVVVLKGEESIDRYTSSKDLYEYGFNEFSYKKIARKGETVQTIDVKNGSAGTRKLNAILEDDIVALVSNTAEYTIEPNVTLEGELKAPIQAGTKLGTVTYEIEGIKYETNLLAENDVEKTCMPIAFLLLFISLILIFSLLKVSSNKKKKRRKRKKIIR